jgi:rhodanese-related sulfurtransferase
MTTVSPATIDAAALRRLRVDDPEVRLLDVRTSGEFQGAHIEGAYNVPLDQLGEHVGELAHLHHPIVVVCQSGARASKAMERLAAAGKVNLRLLAGGMNAWQAAGREVMRPAAEKWSLERQVRLVAGSIVLASILVSVVVPSARYVAGAVGAGLTFAALTNTCAMGAVLSKLPYNRGAACDFDAVVRRLAQPS